MANEGRILSVAGWVYLALVAGFVFAPVASMTWMSFQADAVQSLPVREYSTRWYTEVWRHADIRAGLVTSLKVGLAVAGLSTLLGFVSAHVLCRLRPRHPLAYFVFVSLPALFPLVLGGVAMLMFFSRIQFPGSIWLVIAGHIGYCSPFAAGVIYTSYRRLNVERELAARNLGATRLRVVWEVVVPQLYPALAAAALLSFLISWDEFTISWFVGGFDKTLPVVVYGMLGGAVTPVVNVVGVVVTTISALGLAAILWLMVVST